jgi:hypothetical protein
MLYGDLSASHEVECFDTAEPTEYSPHHRIKASDIDVRGFDIVLYFAGVSRKGRLRTDGIPCSL